MNSYCLYHNLNHSPWVMCPQCFNTLLRILQQHVSPQTLYAILAILLGEGCQNCQENASYASHVAQAQETPDYEMHSIKSETEELQDVFSKQHGDGDGLPPSSDLTQIISETPDYPSPQDEPHTPCKHGVELPTQEDTPEPKWASESHCETTRLKPPGLLPLKRSNAIHVHFDDMSINNLDFDMYI